MNLKSYNETEIKRTFKELFSKPVDVEHLKQMLSYRFLGELEQITDERQINRKELAAMLGVTPSYITQLYRGSKIVNMDFLAKVESAFDFRFEVRAVAKEILEINESADHKWNERQLNKVIERMPPTSGRVWMSRDINKRALKKKAPRAKKVTDQTFKVKLSA